MTFQKSPKESDLSTTSGSGTSRPFVPNKDYGRIRLDEAASQELLLILRNELTRIPHATTEPNRGRKRRLERMLAELHRMRQEQGWE